MNVQTFAEQIAVVQARHHEREKELLELLRRLLATLEGKASITHKEYVELKRQVRQELADAVGSES